MSIVTLLNGALAIFLGGALLSLLLRPHKPLSAFVAAASGLLGSLGALTAGALVLGELRPATIAALGAGHFTVQVGPLNSVWLLAFGLPGFFVSLFQLAGDRPGAPRTEGWLLNLLLAAATLAVTADNLATLVVMAEIMSLAAVFLTGESGAGKLWFALGRCGTLLLIFACGLLWRQYGTLNFTQLHELTAAQPLGDGVRLLGLAGFGLLAGLVPLHGGVVQAHAQAGSPAAALFSAVVLKVGLYGLLMMSLIDSALPLWWGVLVMLLGMLTAFIGGLYALMEHNIHRLLAYHTLENIGIILLGLGAGLTGLALREPVLIALGMTGGLYHLFNHSLFKTTLFLSAGAVWFRTGHRDIEKLGGIGKKMPVISLAMLVGLMAMAALPPLNGFAGEWVIYQSFFRLGQLAPFAARMCGPLLAVGLAITGALAVMCMAKVYGVTFLGAPRTAEAENAQPAPWPMTLSAALCALCCVAGGVGAPWLLPLLHNAVPLPLVTAHTGVAQLMITLLLLGSLLLPFLLLTLLKGDRLPARTRGGAWVCGYEHESAMVITAHGFAQPVRAAFAPVIALRRSMSLVAPGWRNASPVLCRRLAVIELAVLLVVVISRGV